MNALDPKAALKGLLDFSFRSLVTPYIAGLAFMLTLVAAALGYVYNTIDMFNESGGLGVFYMFVLGPLIAAITAITYRIFFELAVIVIRIWSIRRDRLELLRLAGQND
jgi:hypothetical protein